jgi:Family of unknown function (DUF6524)
MKSFGLRLLGVLALVLTGGMSWSNVRRRVAGQVDVREGEGAS